MAFEFPNNSPYRNFLESVLKESYDTRKVF